MHGEFVLPLSETTTCQTVLEHVNVNRYGGQKMNGIIADIVENKYSGKSDDPDENLELKEELVQYLISHRGDKNGTPLDKVIKELEKDNII